MVDAAASFEAGNRAGTAAARTATDMAIEITVMPASDDALAGYERLCSHALHSPAQSPQWIRAWTKHCAADALIATLHENGEPVFALALEVVPSGPFRVARFMGGKHANGNFAPAPAAWLRNDLTAEMRRVAVAIRKARPDIDALRLERMARDLEGMRNPLLAFGHAASPNLALAVNLEGGFDGVLERVGSKRRRKKHRSQIRKLDAAGGYRRIEGRTREDARRLLATFFAMKQERFAKMGIADAFGSPEVRAFFEQLFTDALSAEPAPFMLQGLEVGGTLRAVTGTSRCGGRLICEFGAIREDELSQASPGDFLFFENIKAASENGFSVYDFSVGDEPYKRLWCNLVEEQADAVVPLSFKGRLAAFAFRAGASAKSFVKNNATIWNTVKALRRRIGTSAAARQKPDAQAADWSDSGEVGGR